MQVYPFVIPLLVGCIIQAVKLVIDLVQYRRLHWNQLWIAGGFPSVHSGLGASITTLVYLIQGAHSILFAVTVVFMLLISYDAMNVRYEAGRHAYFLNHIRNELKDVLWQKDEHFSFLKERIGHTPLEVFGGWIFGIGLTVLLYQVLRVWGLL